MQATGGGAPQYELKVEEMRKRFTLNKRGAREIEGFTSMEECIDTLFQKYQDNIVLLVSN